MSYNSIDLNKISMNPYNMIGKDWYLITAGDINKFNTMTASWGQTGVIWGVPTFTILVRPSRYTYEFVEKNDTFTVSFFDSSYKQALNFCGSHSGRDYDKPKEANITPIEIDGNVSFKEANLIFVCRKKFETDITQTNFLDDSLLKFYDTDPYHKMFIAEITAAYEKK